MKCGHCFPGDGEGAEAMEDNTNQAHGWSSRILFLLSPVGFFLVSSDCQLGWAPSAFSAKNDGFYSLVWREKLGLLMMMKDTCKKQSVPLQQEKSQYLGHCRGSEPFLLIPSPYLQGVCQAVPEGPLAKGLSSQT